MNSRFDVYKFSIDILENNINDVLINHKNYIDSSNKDILEANEVYINELKCIINKLKKNVSSLESNVSDSNIEETTKKLRDVIKNESNNLMLVAESAKSMLKDNNNLDSLDKQMKKLEESINE